MSNILENLKKIDPKRLYIGLSFVILVTSLFIYLVVKSYAPIMEPLFSNIDPVDGGKILEKLKALNVETEVNREGTQILVPSDQIPKLRMELAQEGLSGGGSFGYEIFDKNDMLGTTNALLDINKTRALEGELVKSIKTIQGILGARVHLVLPKKELFGREKETPAASVILKTRKSVRLSANQIQAIQYLISSAVPGLVLDRISIIDDKGNLLAKGSERLGLSESLIGQQETRRNYEQSLSQIIESLLDKTLGMGKSRAEVSVEMDFDKITSTSVEYDPESQVARSASSFEEENQEREGRRSSIDNVSIQSSLPDQQPSSDVGGQTQSNNQLNKTEENITYEISSVTKTHVKETGTVKRLSIAVLIDGTYQDGTFIPRNETEINELKELIKNAVGFNEQRGDNIKLSSMPFAQNMEELVISGESSWFKLYNFDRFLPIGLLAIIGFLFLFFIVRPFLLKLSQGGQWSVGPYTIASEPLPPNPTTSPFLSEEDNLPIEISKDPANQRKKNTKKKNRISSQKSLEDDFEDDEEEDEFDEFSKERVKKKKFLFNDEEGRLDSFLNQTDIHNKVKESPLKRIGEIVEKHPEEVISVLRNWMYRT